MLGPFEKAVDRPSRMYVVGLLFGLGFDTATEIGLLALAGAATLAAVPWWAALTLPILFAAGMSAFDTTQGAVMRRAYTWQPGRRRLGEVYARRNDRTIRRRRSADRDRPARGRDGTCDRLPVDGRPEAGGELGALAVAPGWRPRPG